MPNIDWIVDPRIPVGCVVAAVGMPNPDRDTWEDAQEILVMRIRDGKTIYHRRGNRILVTEGLDL